MSTPTVSQAKLMLPSTAQANAAPKKTAPISVDPAEQHADQKIQKAATAAQGLRNSGEQYQKEFAKTVEQLEITIVAGHDAHNFIQGLTGEVRVAQTVITSLEDASVKDQAQEKLNQAIEHMNVSIAAIAKTKGDAKQLGIKTDAQVATTKRSKLEESEAADNLAIDDLTGFVEGSPHANQEIQKAVKVANNLRTAVRTYEREVAATEKQLNVVIIAGQEAQKLIPGVAKEVKTAMTIIETLNKPKQGNEEKKLNGVINHMMASVKLIGDTKQAAQRVGVKTDAKVAVNSEPVKQQEPRKPIQPTAKPKESDLAKKNPELEGAVQKLINANKSKL